MTGVPRYEPEALGKPGSAAYQLMVEVLTLLRGNLNLHDHVDLGQPGMAASFIFDHQFGATPNTEDTIDITSLGLAWTPTYILTIDSDNGGMAYASSKGSWNKTTIKAKCTVASTNVRLLII